MWLFHFSACKNKPFANIKTFLIQRDAKAEDLRPTEGEQISDQARDQEAN